MRRRGLAAELSRPYRVDDGRGFRLGDVDPADTGSLESKDDAKELLKCGVEELTHLQAKLWAQDHMKKWGEGVTPLGKLGDVKDLVGAAIFLASHAAAFVTGQTIRVDGGITAGINWPIEL